CLFAAGGVVLVDLLVPFDVEKILPLANNARVLSCAALLAPVGFGLGLPFATILRPAAARDVGWLWLVNGAGSVAGAAVSMAVAMSNGLTVALLSGAAIYLVAATVSSDRAVPSPVRAAG